MLKENETRIRVQASWDAWQSAEVKLGQLQSVHWFRPQRAPRALIYGHVSCADLVAGNIPHNCSPNNTPHWLRVCVLQKHTVESAYLELARRAYAEQKIAADGVLLPTR